MPAEENGPVAKKRRGRSAFAVATHQRCQRRRFCYKNAAVARRLPQVLEKVVMGEDVLIEEREEQAHIATFLAGNDALRVSRCR